MNELSCLLFPPLRYFISPALTPWTFLLVDFFSPNTPCLCLLGFILFLMESHLHKFMILTWLFIYSQDITAVCPSSSLAQGPRPLSRQLSRNLLYTYHSLLINSLGN